MLKPNFTYFLSYFIILATVNQSSHFIYANQDLRKQLLPRDVYTEDLFIRPLSDGKLLAQFVFKTVYRKDIKNLRWETSFDVFPLSIADIVANTDLHELHFSLTKGNWNYKDWGYLLQSHPPGAQIRVRFSEHVEHLDRSWSRLVNHLSGQFCASLVSADKQTRSKLSLSFDNDLMTQNATKYSIYSNLVEETFCTENLTPWKKLLPCYTDSGLASLLNAVQVLKSSFSSISLDLVPVSIDGSGNRVSLEQTMLIVFNPLLLFDGKQSWSLIKLFGSPVKGICPRANHTLIHVDTSDLDDINKLYSSKMKKQPITEQVNLAGNVFTTFDVSQNEDTKTNFNLGVKQTHIFKPSPLDSLQENPITFETHIAGYGMNDGTIVATINNNLDTHVKVTFMHSLPSFLRLYLHTLKIVKDDGVELKPILENYVLSKNSLPSLIELTINLEPGSQIKILYDFDRVFLRWTDFKPDANRGVTIGAAMLKVPKSVANQRLAIDSHHSNQSRQSIELYSKPLLVILPTPDFSMPYNVICLVCTVLVFAFGPIHAVTTRKCIISNRKSDINNK